MAIALAPARAALRNPRFGAYLTTSGLADAGFWIATVAQGWLVVRLTDSPLWLGIVAGIGQAPALVSAFAGGVLADRIDRRLTLLVVNAALAAVAVVTAIAIATHAISLALLVVLALATGILTAAEHPVQSALLYDLVDGKNVQTAVSLSSVEFSLARTLGPGLGGVVLAALGIAAGFAMYAASLVPLAIFSAILLARTGPRRPPGGRAALGSWRQVLDDRILAATTFLVFAFAAGATPYVALLPAIARNQLHLDARGYSLLSACAGFGALAGALVLVLLGESRGKRWLLATSVAFGSLAVTALALASNVIAAAATLVVAGAVDSILFAVANTIVQQRAPETARGIANAFFTAALFGGIPIGNVVDGALAQRFGVAPVLIVSSLLVVAAAAVYAAFARDKR